MLPKLLTAQEVKEYLHIGNEALYRLLAEKDFPSFKVKHKYYIMEDDFMKWMKDSSKKTIYHLDRDL